MSIVNSIVSFIIIMSFIVFIHEFGHFIFARFFKVRVEEFSIGFGKKLFGFVDKKNTHWKFALIPLGGYVKMFGDGNAASGVSADIYKLSAEERKQSFFFKPIYQKFLIVLAGPLFNYLLGFVIFFFLIWQNGMSKASNVISEVKENSPAYYAGLQAGDEIVAVNGRKVLRFGDIQRVVQLSPEITLSFSIKRESQNLQISVVPEKVRTKDFLENDITVGRIGVLSGQITYEDVGAFEAVGLSLYELYDLSRLTLIAIGQIVSGTRSISDLSGPIKIAQYSSQITEKAMNIDESWIDLSLVFWFVALISVNLGLANLLPIPLLDGGHLFFYTIEMIFKRPIPIKVQEYSYRLGFLLLISVFVMVTFNDLRSVIQ